MADCVIKTCKKLPHVTMLGNRNCCTDCYNEYARNSYTIRSAPLQIDALKKTLEITADENKRNYINSQITAKQTALDRSSEYNKNFRDDSEAARERRRKLNVIVPCCRGRGRPHGSKNKPKADAINIVNERPTGD